MNTLVYACDDNYAGLTAVSAVSALKWNPGLRIVVLGCKLKPDSIGLISSRVRKHGGVFQHFDISDRLDEIAAEGFTGYTSYAAYSRLFIADLLNQENGRIVYLDCDTLVMGPLDDLFDLPLNGKPFGFGYDCVHAAYKRYVRVAPDAPYFNSGVMLADLTAWRTSGASAALREEFAHPRGPNPLGDQDMIVRAWRDYAVPLPPMWNFLSQYFLLSYDGIRAVNGLSAPWATRSAFDEACRAPRICHFSGHTLGRPWFTSSRHPMRELYRAAAAEAELSEIAEQVRPMSLPYAVQYWLHCLLPQRIFDFVAQLMFRTHIRLTYHT